MLSMDLVRIWFDLTMWIGNYSYASGGKKKGVWVQGALSGPGEVIHVDHKVSGVFINDGEMKMPSQLIFSNGYSKSVANPILLGLAVPASE